ncbi:MAG: GTP-binding protein, partial [Burkholderiaceae bacterium]|nr:GTP-binding protein [Burkholderiaceae bacterium]
MASLNSRSASIAARAASSGRRSKNVAIIAHVDHGKTTLVDKILSFCATLDSKEMAER